MVPSMRIWANLRDAMQRRRTREFTRLVEGADNSEYPRLGRLASLVSSLRSLDTSDPPSEPDAGRTSPTRPRAEFRDRLRNELLAAADGATAAHLHGTTTPGGSNPDGFPPGQRRLTAATATAGLSLSVLALGSVAAAHDAAPGEPYYGIKRVTESVGLALAFSPRDLGEQQLELAATRLSEVRRLLHDGEPGQAALIRQALREMDSHTLTAMRSLTRAYRTSAQVGALNSLDSFARTQRTDLAALLPELPYLAQARASESLELIENVGRRAVVLLARACHLGERCSPSPQAPTVRPGAVPPTSATPSPRPETSRGDATGDTAASRTPDANPVGSATAPTPARPASTPSHEPGTFPSTPSTVTTRPPNGTRQPSPDSPELNRPTPGMGPDGSGSPLLPPPGELLGQAAAPTRDVPA